MKQFSGMGKYHAETCGENQDALCSGENRNFAVISLADGVSTCEKSKQGAEITCRAMTDLFLRKGGHFLDFDEKTTADFTLSHILYRLRQEAEKTAESIAAYSSTAASVLVDKAGGRLLCFSLGDSMVIGVCGGQCRILIMPPEPSEGCCVTTTPDAAVMARVLKTDVYGVDSVMLCSDGAWRQMFERNRLRAGVGRMLAERKYDDLIAYLENRNGMDDCSLIIYDLNDGKGEISG